MRLLLSFTIISIYVVLTYANENGIATKETELASNPFVKQFRKYVEQNPKTVSLKEILNNIKRFSDSKSNNVFRKMQTREETENCEYCRMLVGMILDLKHSGLDIQTIAQIATGVCIELEIQQPEVCMGFIQLNVETIYFVLDSRPDITNDEICSIVFQSDNCIANDPLPDWSIEISGNGPTINDHKRGVPQPGPNDLTIVHITDIHYDPHYLEGGNANCGQPACCRRSQGYAASVAYAAGRWGDYRDCDSPWEAVEDVFFQIRNQHEHIDYIYFTGDIIDHGIWITTFPEINQATMKTFNALKQIFPNVPVFPILGNHEAQPPNVFAPEIITDDSLSTQWLYELSLEEWSHWLPETTNETIRREGYYTVLLRPNFRIIVLNNNPCFTVNFWLLYDTTHLSVQLQWLHDTLLEAENNNEKVHILAHIPSGEGDCFIIWSREYNRIVNRFWNTISGQFNGHTHRDQFNVYYAGSSSEYAVNVAWNGGSGTAFSHVNPNYRVYSVEPDTYQITDHETWIYNLTLANIERKTTWFKMYSFLDAYGISDLSPGTLDGLLEEFARNHDKLFLYWQHNVKLGDTSLEQGCDNTCLAFYLCEIATTQHGQFDRCNQLLEIFWANV